MADDWIKFRKKLWHDGRVLKMSGKCPATRAQIVGALFRLWSLADDYADKNGALIGYTSAHINAEVEVKNFCESLPPDWYQEVDGVPQLPDYQRHNGSTAKERAMDSARKRRVRQTSGKRPGGSRTKTGLEERRLDKKRRERGTLSFIDKLKRDAAAQDAKEEAERKAKSEPSASS